MNGFDIIIIITVALTLALIVIYLWSKRQEGSGCHSCTNCKECCVFMTRGEK